MKAFTSIDPFRTAVTGVKKYCAERGKPLPVVEYAGHVKLHGTNAGVHVLGDFVQPQKRSDIISIEADNAGFAAFCNGKEHAFRQLAAVATKTLSLNITFFGEWCGGNIQKGVAICQLPKHFVIFSGYNGEEDKYISITEITAFLDEMTIAEFNAAGIYFINQIECFRVTVDFSKPEDSLAELERLTLAVEDECPWGKFRGVSGVGEGIVWMPTDSELNAVNGLWFKTKGVKHATKDPTKKKTNIEASPEKLEEIRDIVDRVLPAWRLEQGITVLKEQGLEIDPKNTGVFLQWVSKDILKEDADIITTNGYDWKGIVKFILPQARQFYLKRVDEEAFAK